MSDEQQEIREAKKQELTSLFAELCALRHLRTKLRDVTDAYHERERDLTEKVHILQKEFSEQELQTLYATTMRKYDFAELDRRLHVSELFDHHTEEHEERRSSDRT